MTWLLPLALAAAQTGLDLKWDAPAGCATKQEVEALVARWAPGVTRPLEASASIRREGASFVLTLETSSGHRELRSDRCDEVTHGAALVLAMLLDEAAAAPASLGPTPTPRAVTVPPPAPVSQWSGLIRGGAIVDGGALPGPTLGWRLTVGFRFDALQVELSGGTFLAQRVPIPQVMGGQAQLALDFDMLLRGCWVLGEVRVRPRFCGAASLGQLSGTGLGLSAPRTSRALFAAAFAGAGASISLRWGLGLVAHLELGVPLIRTSIITGGQTSVFTTPWLLTRAEAGLEWRFP